jgi:hypothetical protein
MVARKENGIGHGRGKKGKELKKKWRRAWGCRSLRRMTMTSDGDRGLAGVGAPARKFFFQPFP